MMYNEGSPDNFTNSSKNTPMIVYTIIRSLFFFEFFKNKFYKIYRGND